MGRGFLLGTAMIGQRVMVKFGFFHAIITPLTWLVILVREKFKSENQFQLEFGHNLPFLSSLSNFSLPFSLFKIFSTSADLAVNSSNFFATRKNLTEVKKEKHGNFQWLQKAITHFFFFISKKIQRTQLFRWRIFKWKRKVQKKFSAKMICFL